MSEETANSLRLPKCPMDADDVHRDAKLVSRAVVFSLKLRTESTAQPVRVRTSWPRDWLCFSSDCYPKSVDILVNLLTLGCAGRFGHPFENRRHRTRMALARRRGTGAVHGHIRSILDSGCERSGDTTGCGHRGCTPSNLILFLALFYQQHSSGRVPKYHIVINTARKQGTDQLALRFHNGVY